MDIDEIKALMQAMAASDLTSLEVTRNGWTLRLTRGNEAEGAAVGSIAGPHGAMVPAAPALAQKFTARPAADANVRSPLSGVVHFRPAPDAAPFVEAGGTVSVGDVLCLVEAMKMFNEVRAERAGTVEALLAAPGAEVEAGQPLLRIA
ncbi:biotin/lipoyl-containing protein [Aureimonas sp. AU12]|jgi:acetyl-CoA carboxylase biotin carboxyl carrier protein|uniref:acetyl-CoA carboxylase biotin carboxyl carrier protein n=1 Tax=Aureimonas sp. AU12 TaxID=1638161 RepID=UPI0007852921|nr:biotin/lipoyl-containing protein [Aureimonas sp. AU12]